MIDPFHLDAPPVSISCGGKLELGQPDGADSIVVNRENTGEIVVIVSKPLDVTAHWPLVPVEAPSGLAIDVDRHRLSSAGENEKMAILDFQNGKLLASDTIRHDVGIRRNYRLRPDNQPVFHSWHGASRRRGGGTVR